MAWLVTAHPISAQEALPSFAEPGISPGGSEIAFVSGGDIWTVPATGGAARLLVAHSGNESRPLYAPDGRTLAFNSDREGGLDIYLMDLGSGVVRRLTHGSGSEQLNGWSRDSEWVYYSANDEDVSGMQDVYRVRAGGGTPMVVAGDAYETEFFASAGPEGGRLAISTRGNMARGQWWRNGHSHIDEAEIWLVTEGAVPTYVPLSTGGKNLWPMWSPNGDRVFFMSDRSGTENLWSVPSSGGAATALTEFRSGRVLWPSVATARPLIAFERDFGIWTHDAESGRTTELDIRLVGSVEGPRPELEQLDDGFGALALSPDEDKVAFVARGEIFAAPADGDAPAVRVTDTPRPKARSPGAPIRARSPTPRGGRARRSSSRTTSGPRPSGSSPTARGGTTIPATLPTGGTSRTIATASSCASSTSRPGKTVCSPRAPPGPPRSCGRRTVAGSRSADARTSSRTRWSSPWTGASRSR